MRILLASLELSDNGLKNLQKIEKILKSNKADLFVFPETTLNPYLGNYKITNEIEKTKELAKKYNSWIIFGAYKNKQNQLFLINNKGKEIYKYTKVNLWNSEKKKIRAGNSNKVVKTPFGNILLLTCYDFAFPEYIKSINKGKADFIICPSFIVDYQGWEKTLNSIFQARSFENLCHFIICDAKNKETSGITEIYSPQTKLKPIKSTKYTKIYEIKPLKSYKKVLKHHQFKIVK